MLIGIIVHTKMNSVRILGMIGTQRIQSKKWRP